MIFSILGSIFGVIFSIINGNWILTLSCAITLIYSFKIIKMDEMVKEHEKDLSYAKLKINDLEKEVKTIKK